MVTRRTGMKELAIAIVASLIAAVVLLTVFAGYQKAKIKGLEFRMQALEARMEKVSYVSIKLRKTVNTYMKEQRDAKLEKNYVVLDLP
jgi:cell division protein FtsB